MFLIALLLMVVMCVLVPWIDRMQKRRNDEWREKRKRIMAMGEDDDTIGDVGELEGDRSPYSGPSPTRSVPDSNNPYRPPRGKGRIS